jgi:hypothetical protein
MKKIFGIGVILFALLMVFAVQSGYSRATMVDQDVGIVYAINDVHQMPNLIVAPCESIQIARGVSVPYKYLISDAITFDDYQSYECNIYYTISRTDYKPAALAGYPKQIDKYPFSGDLGLRYTSSIIT